MSLSLITFVTIKNFICYNQKYYLLQSKMLSGTNDILFPANKKQKCNLS